MFFNHLIADLNEELHLDLNEEVEDVALSKIIGVQRNNHYFYYFFKITLRKLLMSLKVLCVFLKLFILKFSYPF